MIKIFIIGPDTEAAKQIRENRNANSSQSGRLVSMFGNQVALLNASGFDDIDIINRELTHKVIFDIEDEGESGAELFAFIRFDAILSHSLLYFLGTIRDQSLILTAARTSYLQVCEPVEQRNRRLVASGRSLKARGDVAEEFYGVVVLRRPAAIDFLALIQSDPSLAMTDALHRICRDHVIETIPWIGESAGFRRNGGGSYAKSKIITRFRKEARGLGRRKLRDEIRFLKDLPGELRSLYPQVHASGETGDGVYLEEEFLPFVTFRQHLFSGHPAQDRAVERLERILTTVYKACYFSHAKPTPSDYLEQYHYQRAWHRLRHTLERAPVFAPLLKARRLWVNGEELRNVPDLLFRLERMEEVTRLATPDFVSPHAHGDLHFENIMVDPESDLFCLVDPRGYDCCDIYYDFGKISHSLNGKYDFIHEDRFSLEWETSGTEAGISLAITPSTMLALYDGMDRSMRSIYKQITGDPLAEKRTLFAEAFHFCTMMPFHLVGDGKESRAAAIYLTGVQLFNNLFRVLDLPTCDAAAPIDPELWGQREWRNVG